MQRHARSILLRSVTAAAGAAGVTAAASGRHARHRDRAGGAVVGRRQGRAATSWRCACPTSVHGGDRVRRRPFEGAHGLAGAAGWLALNPVEREDYRRLGCLEAEIGGSGIVRRLVWRLKAGDMSRVRDMAAGDMSAITVRQIFEAARAGDGVAISVVRDTARYIGMAIGNLVSVVDPDVVVLGGLIAEAADLLVEPAQRRSDAADAIATRANAFESPRRCSATTAPPSARRAPPCSRHDRPCRRRPRAAGPHPHQRVAHHRRRADRRDRAAGAHRSARCDASSTPRTVTSCRGSSTSTSTASRGTTRSTATWPSRRSPRGCRATASRRSVPRPSRARPRSCEACSSRSGPRACTGPPAARASCPRISRATSSTPSTEARSRRVSAAAVRAVGPALSREAAPPTRRLLGRRHPRGHRRLLAPTSASSPSRRSCPAASSW